MLKDTNKVNVFTAKGWRKEFLEGFSKGPEPPVKESVDNVDKTNENEKKT